MESLDTQPIAQPNSLSKTEDRGNVRSWLWALLVILAAGGGLAWWFLGRTRSPQPQMGFGPASVELMAVETNILQDQSSFIGVLDAQEGVQLKPEIDGRIVQLFVEAGDVVSLGDPILKLSPDRNQAEVNTAIANTNVSRAALTNAQAQVRAAEAEHRRAEAEVALQEEEIGRMQYLVDQGAASQQQLDVVIRNRDGAIASRTAASEQIQAAQAAVQEAEAALNQARSQVSVVQADLADTLVAAPINGIVGEIPIKIGDYVESGDDLTTIIQNQTLDLSLSVPIDYRDQLRLGLPVHINLSTTTATGQESRSIGSSATLEGRISFISPQVDATTQTVTIEAVFENNLGYLSDDQRVEASILWQERPGVLVPATAISRLAGQP
ncbi:MAG: efflux RND transporter periplasmic adaptor subunit, partial [Merismopedia sp. SIO2A8]|nr:efflux RND transporter periplasmic adaptor subunit [Merismopedia sp. SIO2A8]